jgi:hypothetical protein
MADVIEDWDSGEACSEHGASVLVGFAQGDVPPAGAAESFIETSDPGEEAEAFVVLHS